MDKGGRAARLAGRRWICVWAAFGAFCLHAPMHVRASTYTHMCEWVSDDDDVYYYIREWVS